MDSSRIFREGVQSNDGTLNLHLKISLQDIAAVKIVTCFWMNEKLEFLKYVFGYPLEDVIIYKIKQLRVPATLYGKLMSIIDATGQEIVSWINFHHRFVFGFSCYDVSLEYMYPFIDYIEWNAIGKINLRQTAKNILASEKYLTYEDRFKLASIFCLKEEFNRIPTRTKQRFFELFITQEIKVCDYPILYFWTLGFTDGDKRLKNLIEHNERLSINQQLLFYAVHKNENHYSVAIEYLWNELSVSQKVGMTITLIKELSNQPLRFSLLSSVNSDIQIMALRFSSVNLLKDLLMDWVWIDCFLPTAFHMFDKMCNTSYYSLLSHQCDNINILLENNDKFMTFHYYKLILMSFWKNTPKHFKNFIYKHNDGEFLISLTFLLGWERNLDLIQLFLADLSSEDKKSAMLSEAGVRRCIEFVKRERWSVLKLITEHFFTVEEDLETFKKSLFFLYGMNIIIFHINYSDYFDKIHNFLQWAFKSEEKILEFKNTIVLDYCTCGYNIYYFNEPRNKYFWSKPTAESKTKFDEIFLK